MSFVLPGITGITVSRYHGIIGITTDFGEIFSLFLFYIYYIIIFIFYINK